MAAPDCDVPHVGTASQSPRDASRHADGRPGQRLYDLCGPSA